MCIIAAKPAGVPMPSRDTIRTMWSGNDDGAGIMYVEKGSVHIEKGFMKYKSFAKKLDELERKLDLTQTPVVMHFRITTHGGTKPENCHPFPITDNVGALKKLNNVSDIGVAHNGIISITPRKGISDTMEYIASQLAPLKRALPRFYENKHAMQLVKNAIGSKMAFLTKEGKIFTVGDFIEDEGVLYSNNSYLAASLRYRSLSYSAYGGWYDDYDYADCDTPENEDDGPIEADGVKDLCWLYSGDYVVSASGDFHEGYDFLLDEKNQVWQYDWANDLAIRCPGATAFRASNLPAQFDFETADCTAVCTKVEHYYIRSPF